MKTKKTVIAVLTVALIAAFIVGCITPLEETNPGVSKKSVPEGKTLVSLSLGGSKSNARTILPDTSDYTAPEDFSHFLLTVFDVEGNKYVDLESPFDDIFLLSDIFDGDDWTLDVSLDADTKYIFTILAYDDAAPDENTAPLAWGTSGEKVIGSGTDTVDIELHEVFSDVDPSNTTYVGTFSWSFTGALLTGLGTFDSYEVRLAPIGTPASNIISDGVDKATGSEADVKPGIYMLFLVLSTDGYETAYMREIVYIFSGFETILDSTSFTQALPTLRHNRFTVTFNYGDDNPASGRPSSFNVNFGHVIKTEVEALFADFYSDSDKKVPEYSDTGYHFDKWLYTNASGATLAAGDKMLKAITLYATWAVDSPPSGTDVDLSGITFVHVSGPGHGAPDASTSTITYNSDNTLDMALVVTGLTVTGSTTFSWYYGAPDAPSFASDASANVTVHISYEADVDGYTYHDYLENLFQNGPQTIFLKIEDESGTSMYSYTFTKQP